MEKVERDTVVVVAKIAGVNVKTILEDAKELVYSETIPKELVQYRKGRYVDKETGPILSKNFPYIQFKRK